MRIVNWIGELVGSVFPVILLALVIISVGADVIGRNVFSAPIFGASEVSVLAFVWLVWLGVIGAAKRDDLMGVRYFVDLLPPRGRHLVHATMNVMVALIAAGVIYAAIMQIRTARFTTFMSIDVPKWVMSVGLAISMAAILAMFPRKGVERTEAGEECRPVIALTFLVFLVLLFAGMPISFVLLGSAMSYFLVNPIAPSIIAQRMNGSLELFPLLAVPFFVFAGAAMARGGIADRLYGFAEALVGHWRGGLAQVAVINSLFMGAMSGSSNADAAIDARTIVPIMRKQGYSNGFASAISACSGVIAPVLPPSIGLIIYGLLTNTSIGQLFIGGIIPAFIIAAALMITVHEVSKRRGYGSLRPDRMPAREVAIKARHAVWALAMPFLLLFGLRIGWFTPTELGAIAAAYALFVGLFVYPGFQLP